MSKIHDKFVIELAEVIKGYGNDPDVDDPFRLSEFYRFYELPEIAVSANHFKTMIPLEVVEKNAQPGWIPTSERLPEESSPWRTGYLATVTSDTWSEPSVMYVQWETTTIRGKEVSRWIWNDRLFPKCWNLVAWMPLPKPWEGGQDGKN